MPARVNAAVITGDGKRILLRQFTVVQNWQTGLNK
jgi:hypothetical protein